MKFSTHKVKQMANSVIRGEKHYGEHLMMSPVRDWYIGILLFLGIAVAGAFWAAAMFFQYEQSNTYEASSAVDIEVYKSATVEAALKELDERSTVYAQVEKRLTARVESNPLQGLEDETVVIEPKAKSVGNATSTKEVLNEEEVNVNSPNVDEDTADSTEAEESILEGEAQPAL